MFSIITHTMNTHPAWPRTNRKWHASLCCPVDVLFCVLMWIYSSLTVILYYSNGIQLHDKLHQIYCIINGLAEVNIFIPSHDTHYSTQPFVNVMCKSCFPRASSNQKVKETVALELSFVNSNLQLLKEELEELNSSMNVYQTERFFTVFTTHDSFNMVYLVTR